MFKAAVLDTKHHRSPITQGGLEIKVAVAVTWEATQTQSAKFMILRDYNTKWYEFRNSLTQDDSKDILEKLEKDLENMQLNL